MRYLVLADIHANLPAFEAVLQDAQGKYDKILFLGDLSNFGAYPSECAQLLMGKDALCIMGNHDKDIASDAPVHPWNQWSRARLTQEQLAWIGGFKESGIIDGHILVLHGIYKDIVPYDILPNTADEDIELAFRSKLTAGVDEVWFGHYHYDIERTVNGVKYRCIRPVGQHRDRDTRASYYIYDGGRLTQHRVAYDVEKVVAAFAQFDAIAKEQTAHFIDFLRNAYSEYFLAKDLKTMAENEKKSGIKYP